MPRPQALVPTKAIHRLQMGELTCATIYEGMRDRLRMNDIKITIRGVRMVGPGVFAPAGESRILPDNKLKLDYYALPDFEWFMLEGAVDDRRYDPSEKLTREQFLIELLDRLNSFAERTKYSPGLHERVREEIEIAEHYLKGAYDIAELHDISYLEVASANLQLPMP